MSKYLRLGHLFFHLCVFRRYFPESRRVQSTRASQLDQLFSFLIILVLFRAYVSRPLAMPYAANGPHCHISYLHLNFLLFNFLVLNYPFLTTAYAIIGFGRVFLFSSSIFRTRLCYERAKANPFMFFSPRQRASVWSPI